MQYVDQTSSTCCIQQCSTMLNCDVAFVWPGLYSPFPYLLRYPWTLALSQGLSEHFQTFTVFCLPRFHLVFMSSHIKVLQHHFCAVLGFDSLWSSTVCIIQHFHPFFVLPHCVLSFCCDHLKYADKNGAVKVTVV